MSYIDKSYLSTQFNNFAKRISNIFAKKTELNNYANSLFLSEDNTKLILKSGDKELTTISLPIAQITWNE